MPTSAAATAGAQTRPTMRMQGQPPGGAARPRRHVAVTGEAAEPVAADRPHRRAAAVVIGAAAAGSATGARARLAPHSCHATLGSSKVTVAVAAAGPPALARAAGARGGTATSMAQRTQGPRALRCLMIQRRLPPWVRSCLLLWPCPLWRLMRLPPSGPAPLHPARPQVNGVAQPGPSLPAANSLPLHPILLCFNRAWLHGWQQQDPFHPEPVPPRPALTLASNALPAA